MRGKPKASLGSWQSNALIDVESLITKLELALRQAERCGCQACAELEGALMTAKGLRYQLSNRSFSDANWKKITWTLKFLLEVAKEFCSTNDCMFPRTVLDGNWVNHKKAA